MPEPGNIHTSPDKTVTVGGQPHTIDDREASHIMVYLEDNDYIDSDGNITPKYHADVAAEALAPYGTKLQPIAEGVTLLIQSIYDPSLLKKLTENGNDTKIPPQSLNSNFSKKGVSGIMERNQPSVCLHRQLRFTGAY